MLELGDEIILSFGKKEFEIVKILFNKYLVKLLSKVMKTLKNNFSLKPKLNISLIHIKIIT